MKKFLVAAAGAVALGAVAAGTANAAPAAAPEATRVVIFAGVGNTTGGPENQPRTTWTVSDKPARIVTNNDGTLVEDTSLKSPLGACARECAEWWYLPHPLHLQLLEFYWDKPDGGAHVLASDLLPAGSLNSWEYLGKGTYTPLCLTWQADGQANYIALHEYTKGNYTWTKIANDTKCPVAAEHA